MIRVRSVAPLDGYRLRVGFTDGTERTVDVEPYLRGPVFDAVRLGRNVFEAVAVDPDLGTVVWPNGADIDPDVLRGRSAPAWEEYPEAGDPAAPRARRRPDRVAEARPDPPYGPESSPPGSAEP